MLRPRYKPDWVPSWHKDGGAYYDSYEDGRAIVVSYPVSDSVGHGASFSPPSPLQRSAVLDATRISDDTVVTLKKIQTSEHPYEVDIARYFSSKPRASDPANRCVPVYDVLDVPDDPDCKLIVMPLLRKFFDPHFLTVGEAVEFFRQAFEVCDVPWVLRLFAH